VVVVNSSKHVDSCGTSRFVLGKSRPFLIDVIMYIFCMGAIVPPEHVHGKHSLD
jgi:hypothetical protein